MDGASGGKVYFKRPGLISWSYRGTITDEIIGDGKVLWFYQPDLNQAFKSMGASPGISTDFLSGMMNIRKDFKIEAGPLKGALVSLGLEPRAYHPQIKSLVLEVDKKTLLVRKFILKDHYGNTTEVTFANIKVNPHVEDGLFSFTPPEGTVIIEK
jgi:outer membrane lipoprotein carrier protein